MVCQLLLMINNLLCSLRGLRSSLLVSVSHWPWTDGKMEPALAFRDSLWGNLGIILFLIRPENPANPIFHLAILEIMPESQHHVSSAPRPRRVWSLKPDLCFVARKMQIFNSHTYRTAMHCELVDLLYSVCECDTTAPWSINSHKKPGEKKTAMERVACLVPGLSVGFTYCETPIQIPNSIKKPFSFRNGVWAFWLTAIVWCSVSCLHIRYYAYSSH